MLRLTLGGVLLGDVMMPQLYWLLQFCGVCVCVCVITICRASRSLLKGRADRGKARVVDKTKYLLLI